MFKSKYSDLAQPETSWFDYNTAQDKHTAWKFSGKNVVAIVPPSQTELDRYDPSRTLTPVPSDVLWQTGPSGQSVTVVRQQDGKELARVLADNPSKFYTNKPSIGWDPSIHKYLSEYDELCRSGATVEQLHQKVDYFNKSNAGQTKDFITTLSPSQAADFQKKGVIVDMTDQNSIYSPATKAMHSDRSNVGLCAHPEFGYRPISSAATKRAIGENKNYWHDQIALDLSIADSKKSWKYTDPSKFVKEMINRQALKTGDYRGRCSYIELTEDDHDELLSNPDMEVLAANIVW